MSEFLSNLEKTLAGKVYIEQPVLNHVGKIGDMLRYNDLLLKPQTIKQFVLMPPDFVTDEGPAAQIPFNNNDKEFSIEHIQKLSKMIEEWTKKIRFINLILPGSGIELAQTHRVKNILGRYIEAYISMTDTIGKRWDFLIQKLD